MNTKLKNYAAFAAFSFIFMLAFNACGEGSEGPQGPAGEQGVAGKNGENGASCSAKALADGSGFELSCGGEVVGTIKNGSNGTNGKNGTNGLNGNDGSSCSAKALSNGSGYELSCGGAVVGTIKNGSDGQKGSDGSNGNDGTSCSAKALEDGSGYELSCGGAVVGTIKNGSNGEKGADGKNGDDGSSCDATALEDGSGYELTCGGKVVGTIKNGTDGAKGKNGTSCTAKALEDESGYELFCGGKSVGILKNGRDIEKVRGEGFDAWYYGKNSVDGIVEECGGNDRVVYDGFDCTNDDGGWWYSGTNGSMQVKWGPNYDVKITTWEWNEDEQDFTPVGEEGDYNYVSDYIRDGNEIIFEAKQNEKNEDNPEWQDFYIGVDFTEDEDNGIDASKWLGICIKYAASAPGLKLNLRLAHNFAPLDYGDTYRYFELPGTLADGKTIDGDVLNIRWSDFEIDTWYPREKWIPLYDYVSHLLGIKFQFALFESSGSIKVYIQKVGAYGTCED